MKNKTSFSFSLILTAIALLAFSAHAQIVTNYYGWSGKGPLTNGPGIRYSLKFTNSVNTANPGRIQPPDSIHTNASVVVGPGTNGVMSTQCSSSGTYFTFLDTTFGTQWVYNCATNTPQPFTGMNMPSGASAVGSLYFYTNQPSDYHSNTLYMLQITWQ